MSNLTEFDEYIQIFVGRHVSAIILSILGGILNSIMLYMLLHKKQIRSSVHTVYMVQIALTDLLVCAVWLILASVITHQMFRSPTEPIKGTDQLVAGDTNVTLSVALLVSEEAQYVSTRIMHGWYDFHYYVNMFLLASMSVERCAAVWKSMRCQRYQYNRKVIIVISIIMWIVALAFALPEMVNPDFMTTTENGLSRVMTPPMVQGSDPMAALGKRGTMNYTENGLPQLNKLLSTSSTMRPYEKKKHNFNAEMDVLYACSTLLDKAEREGTCVSSNGKLDVHSCINEIMNITRNYYMPFDDLDGSASEDGEYKYGDTFDPISDNTSIEEFETTLFDAYEDHELGDYVASDMEQYVDAEPSLYCNRSVSPEILNGSKVILIDRSMFRVSLLIAVQAVSEHYRGYDELQSMCYPDLSQPAKIYVLVFNLALGFVVPFSIIVFSYVSIACMIGKRVRNRMNLSLSETSTTHFQANQSTSDGLQAGTIQLREKRPQRNSRNDSMSRRMSDFMRYILLRKPHDGLENRSYMTDSDQNSMHFNSSRKAMHPSHVQRSEETSLQGKSRVNTQHKKPGTSEQRNSEDDPLHDPEFEEAIRQVNNVRMRNGNSRIKYSVCHDTTNDNIPQTIEEHPHEIEGENEEEELLRASNGSSITDGLSQHSIRTTPPIRMVQRNSVSRRESGGSYGSSMDSMATDQTSLIPCIDKRHSSATSALTPPTPIDAANPHTNQFFPISDERTAHPRASCGDGNQIAGSSLNDVTRQLYKRPMQRKQFDDVDQDQTQRRDAVDMFPDFADASFPRKNASSPMRDDYSFPPATRGRNIQEDRTNSTWLTSRSTSRFTNDGQQDHDNYKHQPVYNRQSSAASGASQSRRRFSSSSKRSTGGSHSSSRKKNIVHKNAEKQLRVSRTLISYVIVFSLCWLPQRIAYFLFVIEAWVGATGLTCLKLTTAVRILSFVSVLLNPAVYILTQRQFQEYVRKSACVKFMRRWYAKCFKSNNRNRDIDIESRFPFTSDRDDEVEQQPKGIPEERYHNATTRLSTNTKPTYRMQSQTRPVIHSRTGTSQHDVLFAPPAIRHRDATIDEMKEEEAAAEESLEKEMKRLAAEEDKRRKDDINKNFIESSEEDILSNKTGSESGNKTASSSTKSENFEELWKRWLQSGSAKMPKLPSNNADIADMDSEFDNIENTPDKITIANGPTERGVLE